MDIFAKEILDPAKRGARYWTQRYSKKIFSVNAIAQNEMPFQLPVGEVIRGLLISQYTDNPRTPIDSLIVPSGREGRSSREWNCDPRRKRFRTRSRELNLKLRYQRTHSTMTSWSKCRPLKSSRTDRHRVIPVHYLHPPRRIPFAPEPSKPNLKI